MSKVENEGTNDGIWFVDKKMVCKTNHLSSHV